MSAGAWARATDADTAIELVPGTIVHVNEGTSFARSVWRFGGSGTYVIGTTALTLKPLDLATLGAMEGTAVTVPGTTGLISGGITTTATGLLSAGTARWTVLAGGAGKFLVEVTFYRPDNFSAYAITSLELRKNGSLIKNLLPFDITNISGSGGPNSGMWQWRGYITLTDGDYIEFYGDMSPNVAQTDNKMTATINRIGD
jgi:hypothetical protein